MTDHPSRKGPSIPEWQQKFNPTPQDDSNDATTPTNTLPPPQKAATPSSSSAEPALLDQARKFLDDDAIRDASRKQKVAFLETKGLTAAEIESLLGRDDTSPSTDPGSPELTIVHDSTESPSERERAVSSSPPSSLMPPSDTPQPAAVAPKRDLPPIITYPEFLLKPQKPPPLVTFERLVNAVYIFAGISALTYGASKYLVQPMLESLTEARLELAETAVADLKKLNSKLESTVSHVPYIASSAALHRKKETDDEVESVDSDPTELFHRDIATQTSPGRSRASSASSHTPPVQDRTTAQSTRLRSLHGTLSSLLSSTDTHFSQDRLKERLAEFQSVLDRFESTYNPFQVDYASAFTSYGSISAADDKAKPKKPASDNEATKFKAEIRALKGAFLSSRNFPSAPSPFPSTDR